VTSSIPASSAAASKAAPLHVAMPEPSASPTDEHRAALVGGGHLQLEQHQDEVVGDRHPSSTWYVSGRVVASWRFYNGPGD